MRVNYLDYAHDLVQLENVVGTKITNRVSDLLHNEFEVDELLYLLFEVSKLSYKEGYKDAWD